MPERRLLPASTSAIVRDAILTGRLAQGTKRSEPELARAMAISRAPLREALRTLEEEGLIVSVPHRGARVVRVTRTDYLDILTVRTLLEPYVVERAHALHGSELLAPLREARADMMHAAVESDPDALAAAHARFHRVFYEQCGSVLLLSLWSRLETRIRMYLRLQHATFDTLEDEVRTHDDIVSIVEGGDVPAFRAAVVDHLNIHISLLIPRLGAVGGDQAESSSERSGAAMGLAPMVESA